MKTNVIQIIVLAVVGLAIMSVGGLLLCSVCGEPTPEYNARLAELFGWFSWAALLFDNILRGVLGFAIVWIGYKVWPFRETTPAEVVREAPDEQEQPETQLIPICNE